MSGKARWMTGVVLGAALLVNGAAMAQAGPRDGYPGATDPQADYDGYDGYAEDDDYPGSSDHAGQPQGRANGDDFSDVAGAEAAPLPQPPRDERDRDWGMRNDRRDAGPTYEFRREESAMTDACAIAARDEAERDGGYAEVRQMEAPRESRGGFSIDGDVETRSGWRAQDGRIRHFTCTINNGRIQDIYFRRDRAAR